MSQRRPFIAGNWKMNTDRTSGVQLLQVLVGKVGSLTNIDVAVCPPFPYLVPAAEVIAGSKIMLGAQNLYFESAGAYTGEVSANMLTDCGCKFVIVGHSERRQKFGEDDEIINRKVKAALDAGLMPILCVGETLEQHEAGKAHDVVSAQTRNALVGVVPEQFRQVTIAYEPVWAIGTGKVASPEYAESVHSYIRERLTSLFGADLAQKTRIQYGGSVTAESAEGLLKQPNIDGALVGGASLKGPDFAQIVLTGSQLAE